MSIIGEGLTWIIKPAAAPPAVGLKLYCAAGDAFYNLGGLSTVNTETLDIENFVNANHFCNYITSDETAFYVAGWTMIYKIVGNSVVDSVDTNDENIGSLDNDSQYVYAAGYTKIYKIDKSTMDIVGSITVGDEYTVEIKVLVVGDYLYALLSKYDPNTNQVKKVSLQTFQVVGSCDLLTYETTCLCSDGNFLYVGDEYDSYVEKISLSTFNVVDYCTLSQSINDVLYDNGYVYALGDSKIFKIDASSMDVVGELQTNLFPGMFLAIGGGYLYAIGRITP